MPKHLKDGLSRSLTASLHANGYSHLWTPIEDSDELEAFDCLHFSVYARNITQESYTADMWTMANDRLNRVSMHQKMFIRVFWELRTPLEPIIHSSLLTNLRTSQSILTFTAILKRNLHRSLIGYVKRFILLPGSLCRLKAVDTRPPAGRLWRNPSICWCSQYRLASVSFFGIRNKFQCGNQGP